MRPPAGRSTPQPGFPPSTPAGPCGSARAPSSSHYQPLSWRNLRPEKLEREHDAVHRMNKNGTTQWSHFVIFYKVASRSKTSFTTTFSVLTNSFVSSCPSWHCNTLNDEKQNWLPNVGVGCACSSRYRERSNQRQSPCNLRAYLTHAGHVGGSLKITACNKDDTAWYHVLGCEWTCRWTVCPASRAFWGAIPGHKIHVWPAPISHSWAFVHTRLIRVSHSDIVRQTRRGVVGWHSGQGVLQSSPRSFLSRPQLSAHLSQLQMGCANIVITK